MHVISSRSDHCLLFLNLEGVSGQRSPQRIFMSEIMWEREPSLLDEIRLGWNVGVQVQDLGDISVTSPPLKRTISPNQDYYGVSLPK
jgi:hypothetical protein